MHYSSFVRVRFCETDAMKIVHHAEYLRYFEVARVDAFRTLGYCYRNLEESGFHFAVAGVGLEYRRSARFDDQLEVFCWVSQVRGASLRFSYEIKRSGAPDAPPELIARGHTHLAFTDDSGKPRRLPKEFRAALVSVLESDPPGDP